MSIVQIGGTLQFFIQWVFYYIEFVQSVKEHPAVSLYIGWQYSCTMSSVRDDEYQICLYMYTELLAIDGSTVLLHMFALSLISN